MTALRLFLVGVLLWASFAAVVPIAGPNQGKIIIVGCYLTKYWKCMDGNAGASCAPCSDYCRRLAITLCGGDAPPPKPAPTLASGKNSKDSSGR